MKPMPWLLASSLVLSIALSNCGPAGSGGEPDATLPILTMPGKADAANATPLTIGESVDLPLGSKRLISIYKFKVLLGARLKLVITTKTVPEKPVVPMITQVNPDAVPVRDRRSRNRTSAAILPPIDSAMYVIEMDFVEEGQEGEYLLSIVNPGQSKNEKLTVMLQCIAGPEDKCSCAQEEFICGAECSDLASDRNHCGLCNKFCPAGRCQESQCVCDDDLFEAVSETPVLSEGMKEDLTLCDGDEDIYSLEKQADEVLYVVAGFDPRFGEMDVELADAGSDALEASQFEDSRHFLVKADTTGTLQLKVHRSWASDEKEENSYWINVIKYNVSETCDEGELDSDLGICPGCQDSCDPGAHACAADGVSLLACKLASQQICTIWGDNTTACDPGQACLNDACQEPYSKRYAIKIKRIKVPATKPSGAPWDAMFYKAPDPQVCIFKGFKQGDILPTDCNQAVLRTGIGVEDTHEHTWSNVRLITEIKADDSYLFLRLDRDSDSNDPIGHDFYPSLTPQMLGQGGFTIQDQFGGELEIGLEYLGEEDE